MIPIYPGKLLIPQLNSALVLLRLKNFYRVEVLWTSLSTILTVLFLFVDFEITRCYYGTKY